MEKIKIVHDRPNFIGCYACVSVASKFWLLNYTDRKSDLIGSKRAEDGHEERDIEEKDFETLKESAVVCPVNVIHIIKDKKKII